MPQQEAHSDVQLESEEDEWLAVDPRYDPSAPVWYDTVKEAAQAWLELKFPMALRSKHPPGHLRAGSENKIFHQDPGDVRGHVAHGDDTCALRIGDDTVLLNGTCEEDTIHAHHPIRSASFDLDQEIDIVDSLPFAWVELIAERETDLDLEDTDFMDGVKAAPHLTGWDLDNNVDSAVVVLNHESGWTIVVGRDPSAHFQFQTFGFVCTPETNVETPHDALAVIRPEEAQQAINDGRRVKRHGEWFLIPGDPSDPYDPAGSEQKTGVSARPFGGSPLDNHIPREWATGVEDHVFVKRFLERADLREGVTVPQTPQEVADLVYQHTSGQQDVFEHHVELTYPDLWAMAETIYVKGTIRHRETEHSLLGIQGGWHKAITHDHQVYTADQAFQTLSAD